MKILSLLALCLVINPSIEAPDLPGQAALENFPLIDGHNDLPYNLYTKLKNQINDFHFDRDLSKDAVFGVDNCNSCNTDLVRIKKGALGAQFWSAFVDCNPENRDTVVSRSFEQVDLIKRLIAKYPHQMELVTTADEIEDAFLRKRLGSLIGLEGGHSIDNKMALLRQFYELGVRYMTLTHICNLPWADSSLVDESDSPLVNLTDFGKKIVLEMNRLGMIVDLSHVSHNVMSQVLEISKAPVIFSHSAAYSIHPHHRNVKDDILKKLKTNDGVIMVNFYSDFIGEGHVTVRDVIKHINYVVEVIGVDHVGLGSDFDGVDKFPEGLEDVSKYPRLFDLLRELDEERWTIENLEKLAGRNFFRVFKKVEGVRDKSRGLKPDESLIPEEDLAKKSSGTSQLTRSSIILCLVALALLNSL